MSEWFKALIGVLFLFSALAWVVFRLRVIYKRYRERPRVPSGWDNYLFGARNRLGASSSPVSDLPVFPEIPKPYTGVSNFLNNQELQKAIIETQKMHSCIVEREITMDTPMQMQLWDHLTGLLRIQRIRSGILMTNEEQAEFFGKEESGVE